jgi:uncharacterized membrane protein YuzA (DUF378 family)
MSKRQTVEVKVRNQVLWVGAEAYPVHNIARAQTVSYSPRRVRAVLRFLGLAVLWALLGFVVSALGGRSSDASQLVWAVVGLLVLINLVSLIRTLAAPTLYGLLVETSGHPHTALVTADLTQLREIVTSIMDAINNPHATSGPFHVENFHLGDRNVHVHGGKVGVIGDRGSIGRMG